MGNNKGEKIRMLNWIYITALVYGLAFLFNYIAAPVALAAIFYKLGNVSVAAFIGYRIDRAIFGDRIGPDTPPLRQLSRALIVTGAMLSISMGL